MVWSNRSQIKMIFCGVSWCILLDKKLYISMTQPKQLFNQFLRDNLCFLNEKERVFTFLFLSNNRVLFW